MPGQVAEGYSWNSLVSVRSLRLRLYWRVTKFVGPVTSKWPANVAKKYSAKTTSVTWMPEPRWTPAFFTVGRGGIGIGRMSYGGALTIKPGVLDTFALIQMPIRGEEQIQLGDQKVVCNPSMGTVINAHTKSLINHRPNTEKLIIRIERSLIEQHCQQLLGRTLAKNIEFESAIPIASESGARWLRMVSWVYDCLSLDDELSPLMSAQLESGLVHMLLTNQPHNYSAEILADAPSLAPSFVKRVERYIEDHAHEPITIVDMAEHAGVSSRSLFAGFRRYRDTSPMLYLKEIRLRRVNEELLRRNSGNETVTAVAFRWGFNHLGHFTTDYKRRFGESPSATLAR